MVFGAATSYIPGWIANGFRLQLTLTLIFAALWGLAALLVAAISMSALAEILLERFDALPDPSSFQEASGRQRNLLRLAGLAVIAFATFGMVSGTLLAPALADRDPALVIAHRGAAGTHPENTMAAIHAAVEAGADWVEIDVQETADGTVVVFHDSDFMKLATNPLKIWDATDTDLQDIDIGSWYDPAYADQRVPTLAEALEAVRDRSKLLIELKYYGHDQKLEERTIDIVEAAGMADQVATMSLKYPAVEKMKSLRPDWQSGVLAATAIGDLSGLEGDFIAINATMASSRLIRRAHEQNKKLLVWTINDPLDMSAMISLGVDGLITDHPELAREVIASRETLTPAERIFLVLLEHLGLLSLDAETTDETG